MGEKKKMIHRDQFMQGRATPDEAHRAIGIRKKCEQCGGPAAVRIKVLVALDELTRRRPEFVAQIMVTNPNGPFVPTVATTHGPMVKVSDIGACDLCRKSAEVAAARGPSWCIVEIDRRGLSSEFSTQVQVPLQALS